MSDAVQDGFSQLSWDMQDIQRELSGLNSTFTWGFTEVLAELGQMNDSLEELVQIAKNPVQTVAFNHFDIARQALRKGLYREALDEVRKAIDGDHSSPGYRLEWRFHMLRGTVLLGGVIRTIIPSGSTLRKGRSTERGSGDLLADDGLHPAHPR